MEPQIQEEKNGGAKVTDGSIWQVQRRWEGMEDVFSSYPGFYPFVSLW